VTVPTYPNPNTLIEGFIPPLDRRLPSFRQFPQEPGCRTVCDDPLLDADWNPCKLL
jgi:hypothetical protein